MKKVKLQWAPIILFGFIGQFAWNIENMYFNTFLFNYIGGSTTDISNMVSLSALVATITTLLSGSLSDKVNRRKIFISLGTILWGLSTLAFAFISRENVALVMRNASLAQLTSTTVLIVIIMDCIMTFFGSTSNDAAFNSWITDITDDTNRARVEGVLSCMPLVAMLVVVGSAGLLIDILGYPKFFITIGLVVSLTGFLGLFIVKESKNKIKNETNYFSSLIYGFKIDVIKENKKLYILFFILALFNIGIQIYMPYLIIYLEKYLGFSALEYSIALAFGVLVSSIIGIIIGSKIDKNGKSKYFNIALVLYVLGLVAVFIFKDFIVLLLLFAVVLSGNILITIILNSSIRKYTPEDKVGLFQGLRMIFLILIPMSIGPKIGNLVIKSSNTTFINEYNEVVLVPVPTLFLVAAICSVLIIIPFKMLKED